MPSVPDLTGAPGGMPQNEIRVMFASGIAELNDAVLERFAAERTDLPLCVVAEFQPVFPLGCAGEWIAWHVKRSQGQNLADLRAALAGRHIAVAAVVYDRRSALDELRGAARVLAPNILTAYDEHMRSAPPGALRAFLLRRKWDEIGRQFRTGGRLRSWLRRLGHPAEAEIPLRARMAQARGLAARRVRGKQAPAPIARGKALQDGITIVIPSRDGAELLREMLPPLLAQLPAHLPIGTGGAEVIVVDNGSSDGTQGWLARDYPAVRTLVDGAPLSFARAVNRGIREARYTRTLLLNNDMIVEPGFIDALQQAFESVPNLFCATAQILFPPGVRREETGKAVWRRTSELDFPVRCDDPVPGEDLTWVLYGSGGCSLFDTAKLAAIGGVAELYEPAYVEDLDFGYRAWMRGWPTVFCAHARVEHRHRSTTSRFYSERQIDFFVERNYLRFVANAVVDKGLFDRLWKEGIRRLQLQAMQGRGAALDTLRAAPRIGPASPAAAGPLSETEILSLANGDVAVFPGKFRPARKTVLIASPYLPFPLSHGGAVRIFNLMKMAAYECNLILVAWGDELIAPAPELLALCSQIVLVRRHGSHYRRETERPDMVEEFDSATFRACLKQAIHQWRPDIVQLEFTWMAQYADVCRGAKTILVEHDITFDLQRQLLDAALVDTALPDKTTPDKTAPGGVARLEQERQLAKWREFETAAWSKVDCVVTMSQQDSRTITGARSVECIPNGVDCARFQPGNATPEPRRLLLIGSFAHLPNLLALEFFLREVWPRLSKGYSLHVIGGSRHEYYLDYFRQRMASDLTRDLAQAGVEVEGFVADVRGAYDRAALVVAPLTASAGTNIKVLEAMAMGKAVISTSAGVNGLDVTAGQDFLLADTGERMAELIEQMVDDDAGRRVIGKNARLTALRYDWVAIGKRQHALHARLLEARQTEVHLTEVHLTEVRQTEAGRLPGSLRDIQ